MKLLVERTVIGELLASETVRLAGQAFIRERRDCEQGGIGADEDALCAFNREPEDLPCSSYAVSVFWVY